MKRFEDYRTGAIIASALTLGVATLSAIATGLALRPETPVGWFQPFFDNYAASLIILVFIPVIVELDRWLGGAGRPLWPKLLAVILGGLAFAFCHVGWTLQVYRVSRGIFDAGGLAQVGPIGVELARELVVFALLLAAILIPARRAGHGMADPAKIVLTVRDGVHERKLDAATISRLRASRNYVVITHAGGEATVRSTLAELAAQLPDTAFIRVNRSVLVQRDHIVEIRRAGTRDRCVVLKDGGRERISRAREAELRALFRA